VLAKLVVLNFIGSEPFIRQVRKGYTRFKLGLEAMKDAHVSPLRRLFVG
jgi:hypothetical protein